MHTAFEGETIRPVFLCDRQVGVDGLVVNRPSESLGKETGEDLPSVGFVRLPGLARAYELITDFFAADFLRIIDELERALHREFVQLKGGSGIVEIVAESIGDIEGALIPANVGQQRLGHGGVHGGLTHVEFGVGEMPSDDFPTVFTAQGDGSRF